jgi:hypothetical protein
MIVIEVLSFLRAKALNHSHRILRHALYVKQRLGFGLFSRIAIALLLVAPLGFVLGMPFPLGLRVAMQRSSALGACAWGVNGFLTVIGTVLALMLGMMVGFRMVLFLACACYLVGLLVITRISSRADSGAVKLREPTFAD